MISSLGSSQDLRSGINSASFTPRLALIRPGRSIRQSGTPQAPSCASCGIPSYPGLVERNNTGIFPAWRLPLPTTIQRCSFSSGAYGSMRITLCGKQNHAPGNSGSDGNRMTAILHPSRGFPDQCRPRADRRAPTGGVSRVPGIRWFPSRLRDRRTGPARSGGRPATPL